MQGKEYKFKAKVWEWAGPSAWHFVTLPEKDSVSIKTLFGEHKRGFGSLKVQAVIGSSAWKTSIFPEKKGTYLLPIKADVRKKEKISSGSIVNVYVSVLL